MSDKDKVVDDQTYARIMRLRKFGLALAAAGMLYIAVPMLIGSFSGLSRGEVWDPYTGRSLDEQAEVESSCIGEAEGLMVLAGAQAKMSRDWDQRTRRWVVRCRDGFPTLYQALMDTRERLRSGAISPEGISATPGG